MAWLGNKAATVSIVVIVGNEYSDIPRLDCGEYVDASAERSGFGLGVFLAV